VGRGDGQCVGIDGYHSMSLYDRVLSWAIYPCGPRVAAPILYSIYVSLYSRMCGNIVSIDGVGEYHTVGDPGLMRMNPRVGCRGCMSGEIEQIDWNLVSDVKASDRRTQVLRALAEKPQMNSDIADKLGVSTKWTRTQVKWLEKRGLVEELTEEKHNYKLYQATEKGEQIVEEVL